VCYTAVMAIYGYCVWGIDASKYNCEPIRHIYHRASEELVALVLNFCLHEHLAVPVYHPDASYTKARRAIDTLIADKYIELYREYGTTIKRPRVYKRTSKFEQMFRMRVKDRLVVKESVLQGPSNVEIPGLEQYRALALATSLTLSTGAQVYRRINLIRAQGLYSLYAQGTYNYQSGIHKKERKQLLIDNEPTVELDYSALHPNLLLNREHLPCEDNIYDKILHYGLGLEWSKDKRNAMKLLTLAALNNDSLRAYAATANIMRNDNDVRLVNILGVKPKQAYDAILKTYSALTPYICRDKELWKWLQHQEGELMINILERLTDMGIVALPEHDSCIVQSRCRDQLKEVMENCYRAMTGYPIHVH